MNINRKLIPGWGLMLLLGGISTLISRMVVVEGKHPVEAAVLAIILGILIRNLIRLPEFFLSGIRAFEKILILGIVFIGASLNFRNFASQGFRILAVILITMCISFIVIYFLAKAFRLPAGLSILLAVGTTICGGSAIAVTAPLIKAREEEVSYAIGTIALWGLAAIILYPQAARIMGITDIPFGIFAGTAIHSTPQVVGAGFIFSELAGKTATAVKLVRNCFMVPVAFFIALWHTKATLSSRPKTGIPLQIARAFPWFLFGYFVMAGLNTFGAFTAEGIRLFSTSGKFLILLGLVGIGLNTNFQAFKSVGIKPLLVGLFGSLVVALCSIIMILTLI